VFRKYYFFKFKLCKNLFSTGFIFSRYHIDLLTILLHVVLLDYSVDLSIKRELKIFGKKVISFSEKKKSYRFLNLNSP